MICFWDCYSLWDFPTSQEEAPGIPRPIQQIWLSLSCTRSIFVYVTRDYKTVTSSVILTTIYTYINVYTFIVYHLHSVFIKRWKCDLLHLNCTYGIFLDQILRICISGSLVSSFCYWLESCKRRLLQILTWLSIVCVDSCKLESSIVCGLYPWPKQVPQVWGGVLSPLYEVLLTCVLNKPKQISSSLLICHVYSVFCFLCQIHFTDNGREMWCVNALVLYSPQMDIL